MSAPLPAAPGSGGLEAGGAGAVRVCVITAAYPAPSDPTRAIFIENLCRALADPAAPGGRRFEVTVVAPRIRASDPLREVRAGIPVRRFAYPSGGKRLKETEGIPWLALCAYLAAGFAAALAEVHRTNPSVIHCHWVLPAGVIAALVGAATGVPQVLHAHGSDIHRYGRSSPAARSLSRWILGRAERVLAVSEDLSRALSDGLGVGRGRLARLPMGIDAETFGPGDRAAARRALGLERGAEVLFAGDLVREKGVADLAGAIASGGPGADLRLNVAGDGPDRPRLEAIEICAGGRVRLLGRLPPERLAEWYRAADLLVLPSRGEGAPVSVMEALASGLPVVATAVGGVPELVRPGVEGWLAPAGATPEEFLGIVKEALEAHRDLERIRAGLLARGEDRSAARRARELGEILGEAALGRRAESA